MNKKYNLIYLLSLISIIWSPLLWAENVGQIQYTRGAVTMQNMDGSSARLIAKNAQVQRGEVINTGPNSFTIVKLNDGTRMTLRPNSSFSVEKFNATKDSTASAILRLFKGGLRTITGYISKNNPKGYKLRTPVATIGIRGTQFDARLCNDDCEEENSKHKTTHGKQLNNIESEEARPGLYVSVSKGKVNVKSKTGSSKDLKAGQTGYADILGRQVKRLSKQPLFLKFDVYPLPDVPNPDNINISLLGNDDSDMVCEIQ